LIDAFLFFFLQRDYILYRIMKKGKKREFGFADGDIEVSSHDDADDDDAAADDDHVSGSAPFIDCHRVV
jgi:hypothetical protein